MNAPGDLPKKVAKVFMSGRSQAVRLPKEFRFDTDEVTIERRGGEVILRSKPTESEWWVNMARILGSAPGMPFVERSHVPDSEDPPDLGDLAGAARE